MDLNLNKTIVDKKGLLNHIQDIDVYRRYSGKEVTFDGNIKSPIREEKRPSFGYFVSGNTKEICFNDFAAGGGDFIKFVQFKYNLNFYDAMSKIVVDFGLQEHFHYATEIKASSIAYDPNIYKESRDKLLENVIDFKLGKKSRKWELHDIKFWLQFGIDLEILESYNVEPVKYVFINGKPIYAEKYAYCFTEWKDGKETYKIYQPYSEKYKWLNNHNASVWQGWRQLPPKGETLIITKSLKDVMAIVSIMHIPAVALQTESSKPKESVIQELKDRFKPSSICLLYDNDFDKDVNWGREFAKKLSDEYLISTIEIPDMHQCKDFSDLVKKYGAKVAREILSRMMEVPF